LSPGNWTGDPTNHLYFWERDTVPIPGEEASSFQTTIADDGFNIGGGVVAENAFGESLPEDSSNTVFVQVVVLNATMGVEQESFNPATYGYKGPGSSEALLGTIDNDVLYGETATDIYTNSGNDFVVIKLDGGASFGSDYSIKFQIDSEPEVTIDWDSQYSEYSDPLTSLSDYIVSKVGQDVAVKITVLEP
jgi:hypothetical protein